VAILAAGILSFVALQATKPELAMSTVEERVWTVRAAPGRVITVQPEREFYGQIVAGREVALRPLVPGRIVEVSDDFHAGGFVEAGNLLVALDPFDYEAAVSEAKAELAESRATLAELDIDLGSAKAMLEQEKRQLELRQRDAVRYQNLQERGAVSTKAYDDTQIALLNAAERVVEREYGIQKWEATYRRQQAVVDRLKVRLRRAERNLSDTRLEAPFAGYLTDIAAQVGKQVTQADAIARLIDPSQLEARFQVGTQHFGELLQGKGVEGRRIAIVWRLNDTPLRFEGEIERMGSEIDPASGSVDLYASVIDGEAMHLLRPGAFVQVEVPGPRYENVVRLPSTAWHDGKVFVVVDDHLQARSAELVRRLGQDVLVRGDLAASDDILVTPIPGVREGMAVQIVEGNV